MEENNLNYKVNAINSWRSGKAPLEARGSTPGFMKYYEIIDLSTFNRLEAIRSKIKYLSNKDNNYILYINLIYGILKNNKQL